jgi:hypothetical protein
MTTNTPSNDTDYAPKVILMGDSGTGKTTALRTLPDVGITPFVIATEQNFIQATKDLHGTKMHYKYINAQPETQNSFAQILDMAKKINMLSYENLCKVSDPFKSAHNRFLDVITTCNDFVCDCCNKSWGNVSAWGTDRAIVLDSLSGLSDMAFALVVGNKPVRAMPDYGVAQKSILMLLNILTGQVKSMFVLISHLEREKDEITGGTTITLKTVGQKLGPDLPRNFSDVIRARREGTTFTWDTADSAATVVARHVPIKSNNSPSFKPLVEAWIARGGKIVPTEQT